MRVAVGTLVAVLFASLCALPGRGDPPAPWIRAVRLDYKNMARSRVELDDLEERMLGAGVNTVAVGAGRVDWTYFKWRGQRDRWSGDVRDTAVDFLARDAKRFGKWAAVDAVVDVLAPRYISEHPAAAAVSWQGERSASLVSTAQLVDGEFGNLLVAMVEYIAANYPVTSISLTELDYHREGYGEDDRRSYGRFTGRADWPRSADGTINVDDPSVGAWRSHEIGRFISRAAAAAHAHGRKLYVDVLVSWDRPERGGASHGQDYAVLLQSADRLIVWDYFGLSGYPPEYTAEIARTLRKLGPERIVLSVGLWPAQGDPVSPAAMRTALLSGLTQGLGNQWVTPSRLFSDAHWKALADAWAGKP